ncbi:hypothetical protein [Kingella oralis]|uniref:hypothetical protein n=1 Tax=Kingella oralis TaxID=505 RepID=UPI0034E3E55A
MMKTTRCLGEWFFLVSGCLDDLGQPENQSPKLKTTCHTTKPFPFSGCRSQ